MLWRSSKSMPCSPGPGRKASGRSTSEAWLRPLSPTATAGRATLTCTPTSQWRTRCRPLDGRWLSIDGRVLFKANVAASETYNTALEQHLRDSLGVRFAERPGTDPAKRPIREIVGVDPRLNQRWSTRRAPQRSAPRRARHAVPERSWPATDPGRSVAPGTAGDIGDARRQTRTP